MLVYGLMIMAAVVGNVGDGPDAKVVALLKEWREKSQGWKTLEVRFEYGNSRDGLQTRKGDGRLSLGPGTRMAMEHLDRDAPKRASRLVWSDDAIHQYLPEVKRHVVTAVTPENRGKLPAEYLLPFLWGLDTESLHALFDIRIVGENDRVIGVVFKTRKVTEGDFDGLYIELDRSTLLPRKAKAFYPKKFHHTYTFTSPQPGVSLPDDLTSTSTPEGWIRTRHPFASWFPPLWTRQGLLPR